MAEKNNRVLEYVKTHKDEIAFATIGAVGTIAMIAIGVKTNHDLKLANESMKNAVVALKGAEPFLNLRANANHMYCNPGAGKVFPTVGDLGVVGESLMKDTNIPKDTVVTGLAVFVK